MIEKVFELEGEILEVTINGRLIETTSEHPFYVQHRGWCPARELLAGNVLVGLDASEGVVESVQLTNRWASVYNIRVSSEHTYFLGGENWGFTVWVHNSYSVRQVGNQFEVVNGAGVRALEESFPTEQAAREAAERLNAQKSMNVSYSGHHVPSIRKSVDRPFETNRSNLSHPTIHVIGDEDFIGRAHWRMHDAERLFVGPRQGPFIGSDKELFDAYRKSYRSLTDIRVDVRAPDNTVILGINVSLTNAIDLLEEYFLK